MSRAGQLLEAKIKLYHLTDNAKFKLDKNFKPSDNALSIVDRSDFSGIYLAPDIEPWVNGQNYWRPFVVEFTVNDSIKTNPKNVGRWGGEVFVPSELFDELTVNRVIPLDAYAREKYGQHGWVESDLGIEFDTREPITSDWGFPFRGKKYDGLDVRKMSASVVKQLKKDLKQAKGF